MDIALLIKSIVGLIVILAGLIFLLFYSSGAKKKKKVKEVTKNNAPKETKAKETLQALVNIIKNKNSSSKELKEALDSVLKNYGQIHKKMGVRAHPDFDIYMGILFTICRHPNTNKNIILNFDKELSRMNPDYKSEINDAVTKGINSRGA